MLWSPILNDKEIGREEALRPNILLLKSPKSSCEKSVDRTGAQAAGAEHGREGLSEPRALTVVRMSASALRYEPRADPNVELREQIAALAHRHRRYGVGISI